MDTRWIEEFSPGLFASVMGTGIFALVCQAFGLGILAFFLSVLATGLALFLTLPWILRWVLFPSRSLRDLRDPLVSPLYATIGIAFLVLAADFLQVLHLPSLAFPLWLLGTFLGFFFACSTPFLLFLGEAAQMDHVNPSWFIPPVGLVVVPIAGSHFLNTSTPLGQILLLINATAWGSGFFLYLSLLALTFHRLALHKPLPAKMLPTAWINLGPIGAGTVGLLGLAKALGFLDPGVKLFALVFWGSGVWWLAVIIGLTLLGRPIPYSPLWWAFTFPLGAYTMATHLLASLFHLPMLDGFGFLLSLLLAFLWTLTALRTLFPK